MSFIIKNVTVKNFLSIGNQTQAIDLSKNKLTLILGKNLDLGGDEGGARNGTGKTSLLNAVCYALFGQALTNIKKENLINKINSKNMLVTLEFEVNGVTYRVERGRKPNVLKLFENGKEKKSSNDSDDEAQGDSRETQKYIETLIGMSHDMFKHIVALNTYSTPFLSMKAAEQREIIEQLLGITILSEKAEALKQAIKDTKDKIQLENIKIESIKKSNDNIQKSINSIIIKSNAWESKFNEDVEKLSESILSLQRVDIEKELESHRLYNEWQILNSRIKELTKSKATLTAALSQNEKTVKKYFSELTSLEDTKTCPSCNQEIHTEQHELMIAETKKHYDEASAYSNKVSSDLEAVTFELNSLGDISAPPTTYYDTEAEAHEHKNNLRNLENLLEAKAYEKNPYLEQIEELKNTALQEIEWTTMNNLVKVRDHQEFLLKMLTNKDSFVRKKLIDQNLTYLNKRLGYYIDQLKLPHKVVFQNDLNFDITQYGQELDFDNLSRGERNRLILGLSFAFRDVWENLYNPVSILFVDELLDSGMDPAGVDAGLAVLKKMSRERNKNVYLISHKDEIVGRVENILRVIKESGFTSYSTDNEVV